MALKVYVLISCMMLWNLGSAQALRHKPIQPNAPTKASTQPERVRIGIAVAMTEDVKVEGNAKQPKGRVVVEKATQTLNARFMRRNQFYFGKWHVETQPLQWDDAKRNYVLELSVYRVSKYDNEAETKVGTMKIAGPLIGTSKVVDFAGSGELTIENKAGGGHTFVKVLAPRRDTTRPALSKRIQP